MYVRLIDGPREITVRKNHRCQGCGKIIKKGDACILTTCANDDSIYNFHECQECHNYYEDNCIGCKDFDYCVGENYETGILKDCRNG